MSCSPSLLFLATFRRASLSQKNQQLRQHHTLYFARNGTVPFGFSAHIHTARNLFSTTATSMSASGAIIASIFNASVRTPEVQSKSPEDVDTKAHHVKDGKGFRNPWDSWRDAELFKVIKYIISHRREAGLSLLSSTGTADSVPVVTPQFPLTRSTSSAEFRATWLGHACFYVEFPGGLRVLTDPVFSERCSPVQFMGPKRYTKMPCDIADIPVVDIVVISHNHYDHLDYNTILKLKKHHPGVHFFVPLGNKSWFTKTGIENCTELDWWEERDIVLTPSNATKSQKSSSHGHPDPNQSQHSTEPAEEGCEAGSITARIGCLPCQHTSNRGLTDRSLTLWSSWSVESGGKKLYFGGDTGYRAVPDLPIGEDDYADKYKDLPVCPAFKQIGELRGPFDLGLIPIGAYSPRWIMSPMHANPVDSVNIFVDTRCRKALGMHWGTWVLTNEPVTEPPLMLRDALERKGIARDGIFDTLDIGASCEY